jgi:hypothetical protein
VVGGNYAYHDVYCFCGPEIRGTCIGWLKDAQNKTSEMIKAASEDILRQIVPLPTDGQQVVVFTPIHALLKHSFL